MVARADHYDRFIELHNQGWKAADIAKEVGTSKEAIYQMTYRLRGSRVIPPAEQATGLSAKVSKFRRKTGRKLGTIGQIIDPMDEKILHWLASQTPEGGSITEMIRAIIIDAYYEENEDD